MASVASSRASICSTGSVEVAAAPRTAEHIQVVCRIRPLNSRESEAKCREVVEATNASSLTLQMAKGPRDFHFDGVIRADQSQAEVFDVVGKPIANAVLEGFNGTVFAYGQTGSGKTHTVMGAAGDLRGLLPRALDHIFSATAEAERSAEAGTLVHAAHVSYLEIYNEKIFDLLDAARSQTSLRIRQDLKTGTLVEGLTREPVEGAAEALELVARGTANRSVAATAMNHESSRSHAVFTLTLEARQTTADGITHHRRGNFHLIDLAGSERQTRTHAAGQRLKEANAINQSLTVLGSVITGLAQSAGRSTRAPYIRYRDSKLTHLLKDALGGNSRTALVAAMSPSEDSMQETLSTLQFASRTKLVRNRAVVNEDLEGSVKALRAQIEALRAQLFAAGIDPSSDTADGGAGRETGAGVSSGAVGGSASGRAMWPGAVMAAAATSLSAERAAANAARALAVWDRALASAAAAADTSVAGLAAQLRASTAGHGGKEVAVAEQGAVRSALALLSEAAAAAADHTGSGDAADASDDEDGCDGKIGSGATSGGSSVAGPEEGVDALHMSGVMALAAGLVSASDASAAALADAFARADAAERAKAAVERAVREATAKALANVEASAGGRACSAEGETKDDGDDAEGWSREEALQAQVHALTTELGVLRAGAANAKQPVKPIDDGTAVAEGEEGSAAAAAAAGGGTGTDAEQAEDEKTRLARSMRALEARAVAAEQEAVVLRQVLRADGAERMVRLEAVLRSADDHATAGSGHAGATAASGAPLVGTSAREAGFGHVGAGTVRVLRKWLAEEAWREERGALSGKLEAAVRALHEAKRAADADCDRANEADAAAAMWRARAEEEASRADTAERAQRRLQEAAEAARKEAQTGTAEAVDAARERFERLAEETERELHAATAARNEARAAAEAATKRATAAEAARARATDEATAALEEAGAAAAARDAAESSRAAEHEKAESATAAAADAQREAEAERLRAAAALDASRAALARVSSLEQDMAAAARESEMQRRRADRAQFELDSLQEDMSYLEEQMAVFRADKKHALAVAKVAMAKEAAAATRAETAEQRVRESEAEAKAAVEAATRGEEEALRVRQALEAAARAEAAAKAESERAAAASEAAEAAKQERDSALEAAAAAEARATSAEAAARDASSAAAAARAAAAEAESEAAEARAGAEGLVERAEAAEDEAAAVSEQARLDADKAVAALHRAQETSEASAALAQQRREEVTLLRAELGKMEAALEEATAATAAARRERDSARRLQEMAESSSQSARLAAARQTETALTKLAAAREEAEERRKDANEASAACSAAEQQAASLRAQLAATRKALGGGAGGEAGAVADGEAASTEAGLAVRAAGVAHELTEALATIESLNEDLIAAEDRTAVLEEELAQAGKAAETMRAEVAAAKDAERVAAAAKRDAEAVRSAAVAAKAEAERSNREAEERQAREEAAGAKMGGLVERVQAMLAERTAELKEAKRVSSEAQARLSTLQAEAGRVALLQAKEQSAMQDAGRAWKGAAVMAEALVKAAEELDALSGKGGAKARIAAMSRAKAENKGLKGRVEALEALIALRSEGGAGAAASEGSAEAKEGDEAELLAAAAWAAELRLVELRLPELVSRLREAVASGQGVAGSNSATDSVPGAEERGHGAVPPALCGSLQRGVAVAEEQGWLPASDDAIIVRGEAWQPASWDAPAEAGSAGMLAAALALAAKLGAEAPRSEPAKPAREALGASAASNSAAVPSPSGLPPPAIKAALPAAAGVVEAPAEL